MHNSYRDDFFNEFPDEKGKVVVHHSIEQQVLKKYPGLFSASEINILDNLRGIPKSLIIVYTYRHFEKLGICSIKISTQGTLKQQEKILKNLRNC